MAKNVIALRSVSAAAVIGLSLGLGATGAVAQDGEQPAGTAAQDGEQPAGTPAPAGNPAHPATINQTTGTLTIHKKANPESTSDPTGEEDANVSGTPLEGVGFKFFKIKDIDLNTNDGLAKAAKLKASDFTYADGAVAGADLYEDKNAVKGELTTDGDGVIKLENLPIGAYYVVETTPKPGFAPASPFIAFVPMTKGNAAKGGTEWNYDVHAYPKNYESTATKAVEDTNQQVGQDITFSITGDVPGGLDRDKGLTKFVFSDDLDQTKVTYKAGQTPTVEVLGADATADALGTLTYKDDFTVAVDEGTQKLTAELTKDGLAKFNKDYKTTGKKLRLSFAATVKASGELTNKATVVSNNGTGGGDYTTETNETKSYWAKVNIVKKDAEDEKKVLKGAEFEVYGSADNQCTEADLVEDNKIEVDGQKKWTTNDKGQVTINGLHVNDWDDNSGASEQQFKAYCLLETKSPTGYELLSKPIKLELKKTPETGFTGTAGEGATDVKAENYELTATVKNLEDTTPKLPLTGGAGIGILAAIAAVLIGAGALYARRNSKTA
ncbi:SpaH/EbpB family LPXTG-anchored major pilin [Corynebacterium lizhenjunii]|uniref:SpaH/EbpB family LPXTG-anchored major pilin n=1 Tax=Corynebacterium lizhenjunii TaxID=2709394 RepID=A0A7T0KEQ3_9CORY|nr:SpaH/EbpB family LPXTG-anchored major pilin [Corynebacterium lizhenjunii]QPK78910.1 SpaH/EbpB family LPXTG-anchored major pilin [Corynebacterium lizhenjunii]